MQSPAPHDCTSRLVTSLVLFVASACGVADRSKRPSLAIVTANGSFGFGAIFGFHGSYVPLNGLSNTIGNIAQQDYFSQPGGVGEIASCRLPGFAGLQPFAMMTSGRCGNGGLQFSHLFAQFLRATCNEPLCGTSSLPFSPTKSDPLLGNLKSPTSSFGGNLPPWYQKTVTAGSFSRSGNVYRTIAQAGVLSGWIGGPSDVTVIVGALSSSKAQTAASRIWHHTARHRLMRSAQSQNAFVSARRSIQRPQAQTPMQTMPLTVAPSASGTANS
jgi:hypothetical protein